MAVWKNGLNQRTEQTSEGFLFSHLFLVKKSDFECFYFLRGKKMDVWQNGLNQKTDQIREVFL